MWRAEVQRPAKTGLPQRDLLEELLLPADAPGQDTTSSQDPTGSHLHLTSSDATPAQPSHTEPRPRAALLSASGSSRAKEDQPCPPQMGISPLSVHPSIHLSPAGSQQSKVTWPWALDKQYPAAPNALLTSHLIKRKSNTLGSLASSTLSPTQMLPDPQPGTAQ